MDTLQHAIGYIFLIVMLGWVGRNWMEAVWNGKRGDDYNG